MAKIPNFKSVYKLSTTLILAVLVGCGKGGELTGDASGDMVVKEIESHGEVEGTLRSYPNRPAKGDDIELAVMFKWPAQDLNLVSEVMPEIALPDTEGLLGVRMDAGGIKTGMLAEVGYELGVKVVFRGKIVSERVEVGAFEGRVRVRKVGVDEQGVRTASDGWLKVKCVGGVIETSDQSQSVLAGGGTDFAVFDADGFISAEDMSALSGYRDFGDIALVVNGAEEGQYEKVLGRVRQRIRLMQISSGTRIDSGGQRRARYDCVLDSEGNVKEIKVLVSGGWRDGFFRSVLMAESPYVEVAGAAMIIVGARY